MCETKYQFVPKWVQTGKGAAAVFTRKEAQTNINQKNKIKVQTVTAVEFLLFLIPYFHVTAKEEVFLYCDFTPLKKGLDK